MGHIRLGAIPKTRPWAAVVKAVVSSGGSGLGPLHEDQSRIASIAASTLTAARGGIAQVMSDAGLRYTFFLLTQVALASRSEDWQKELSNLGIRLSPDADLFEFAGEIQNRIDDYLRANSRITDVSEMAQKAAGQALAKVAGAESQSLFGDSGGELQHAVRRVSTKAGFADLGQAFFGQFMMHFLNFYLSRITANEVGKGSLPNLASISKFNEELSLHCHQSARIVHDFCGEWYSKTVWEGGIDQSNTAGFIATAIKKLEAELAEQAKS